MDAVTLINKNLDIERLLKHYHFEHTRNDGDFIRSCCKIHEGNNPTAFVINKETGLWYCHTNCGGGDIYTLVQKMEKIDFYSSIRWLAKFFNVNISNLTIAERKETYLEDIKKFIRVVKGKKTNVFSSFNIPEEIREVTKFRQFQKQTIEHFKLGYVESVSLTKKNGETYILKNRLVIPIIFQGIQIGISFRRTRSSDFPKWSHQPANIETGEILYNYDATPNKNTLIVCEGITDVWAFHEIGLTAVATFGAHITETQYKLLLKTGADLAFAYDGDEAGQKTTQKAITMFKNKANISTVFFDEGEDPESIEREVLKQRYETRKKLC